MSSRPLTGIRGIESQEWQVRRSRPIIFHRPKRTHLFNAEGFNIARRKSTEGLGTSSRC